MKELSWKPRHKGNRYCSPACGHGCTWGEYQQARKEAKDCQRKLGKHWKIRVWENCGWFWAVSYGPLSYHNGGTLFISDHPKINGAEPCGLWAGKLRSGQEPVAALYNALKRVHPKIRQLQAVEAEIKQAIAHIGD